MSSEANRSAAQQTLDILYDLSQVLNTQLDREQLATCVALIENGVNPEALAVVIKDLRKGASSYVPASATRGSSAGLRPGSSVGQF